MPSKCLDARVVAVHRGAMPLRHTSDITASEDGVLRLNTVYVHSISAQLKASCDVTLPRKSVQFRSNIFRMTKPCDSTRRARGKEG